jgi:uncharacterized protein (DUF849 family)
VLLQAALNGPYGKDRHPALPVAADELARDAAACVAAGAGAIHLHPRDAGGRESLDADVINGVTAFVRSACGVPVGVSTGAWIEPGLERRLACVGSWSEPDYASVNVSEDGFERVMAALHERGIGIEAGVWSVEDVVRLAALDIPVLRVLVEPVGSADLDLVRDIHDALDRHGVEAPRLQHGDGEGTWLLLDDAISRGLDTRIGLEDTVRGRGGDLTSGNAALVADCPKGQ